MKNLKQTKKDKIWNNPQFRSTFIQVLMLSFIIYFGWWLYATTNHNLQTRGITSGFDFLKRSSGFDIDMTLIDYDSDSSNGRVFFVGLANTLLVSVFGLFFATVIGVTVGVARLSNNWIVAKLATVYVEIFRNIPLLLQIFFWYFAVLSTLPKIRDAMKNGFFNDSVFFSNRGLTMPKPIWQDGAWLIALAVVIGIILSFLYASFVKRKKAKTGVAPPLFPVILIIITSLPVIAFFIAGSPVTINYPEPSRFNLKGGLTIIPEFMAILFALSIYTGAFIAEIVRSGILSVSHGQTEAAHSLAISPSQTLRLIIIPQALRVIIPPLASQYLNLAKNSSLAAAVAYPEIVSIFTGTVLNNSGQALECVAITMVAYLTISLSISALMNLYNRRMSLVER